MLNHPSLQNKTTDVVIQQHSRKLLMMAILMSEKCWAHKKWNKIASDIKLVFHSATSSKLVYALGMNGFSEEWTEHFECQSIVLLLPWLGTVPVIFGTCAVDWTSRRTAIPNRNRTCYMPTRLMLVHINNNNKGNNSSLWMSSSRRTTTVTVAETSKLRGLSLQYRHLASILQCQQSRTALCYSLTNHALCCYSLTNNELCCYSLTNHELCCYSLTNHVLRYVTDSLITNCAVTASLITNCVVTASLIMNFSATASLITYWAMLQTH